MGKNADSFGAEPATTRAKAATIYDVARAAGVSHQTVSRFLKGFEGIRPETRDKVVYAIAALGYRPNLTARSLKSGRSHRIGALTHDISQVGPGGILEGASAAAREAGYMLDIIALDTLNPRAIEESLALITQHDLAGVLALTSTDAMTRAIEKAEFRVPAYVAKESDGMPDEPRSRLSSVGVPALVKHLGELGHRRLMHIAGPDTWSASRNRMRAYQSAVVAQGLQSVGIVHGDWSARSGYQSIADLAVLPDATAFVVSNDQMALGVMLALKERGCRIPEDVSVVGIDDIPEAAYLDPPLTTLRNDFEAQGRAAVYQLLARIERSEVKPVTVPPLALVVRRSSGPAPRCSNLRA